MSEPTVAAEVTQAEMPGMPEQTVVPSFLHVCEFGVNDFATAVIMTNMLRVLPGTDEGEPELFTKAAEKMGRYVREQVGRRVFEVAMDDAYDRLEKIMAKAKERTAKEGRPKEGHPK